MPGRVQVTSRDNPRLVHFRKVRDGRVPGLVFAEGVRLAEEALRSGLLVAECAVTPEAAGTERVKAVIDTIEVLGVRVNVVPEVLFASIASTVSSQGLILLIRRPETGREAFEEVSGPAPLLLFLSQTNDPSNLGAIFRTAEAAGVAAIALSAGSADPLSPKGLRASMGSGLRLPIWEGADLRECADWARGRGMAVVAADVSGRKSYWELGWNSPLLLVLGSEAHGLSSTDLSQMDEVISIPMMNGVESLNLAVSAGVILYEAVRQRTAGSN